MNLEQEKQQPTMRLKILNKYGNCKWQFDVITLEEAYELYELRAKPTDKTYLYIESSMSIPIKKIKQTSHIKEIDSPTIKSDNGRILSRKEIERLGLKSKQPHPIITAMKFKTQSQWLR